MPLWLLLMMMGMLADHVNSKEQASQSERRVRTSVVKEKRVMTFVEAFLIVSLIFHKNVKTNIFRINILR
jgi:hypothetical protein